MLLIIMHHVSFFDIVPQLDYESFVDSEKVFDTFANACAQAGAAKCFPVGLIQGNATGSDVRLLFTSTIDVSRPSAAYVSRDGAYYGSTARFEVAEGRIHRTPSTKRRTQV